MIQIDGSTNGATGSNIHSRFNNTDISVVSIISSNNSAQSSRTDTSSINGGSVLNSSANLHDASGSESNRSRSKFLFPKDYKPRSVDVLIGRGKMVSTHTGNSRLRSLIQSRLREYSSAMYNKRLKSDILRSIVQRVRQTDKGAFLKQDMSNYGRWFDVGDFLAKEKISQMFRDALGTSTSGTSKKEDNVSSASVTFCSKYKSSYSSRKKRKIQIRNKETKEEEPFSLQLHKKQKMLQDLLNLVDGDRNNMGNSDHFEPTPVIEPSMIISESYQHQQKHQQQQQTMYALLLQNMQLAEAASEAAALLGEEHSNYASTSSLRHDRTITDSASINCNNDDNKNMSQELEDLDLCGLLDDCNDSVVSGNEFITIDDKDTELLPLSEHKNTLNKIHQASTVTTVGKCVYTATLKEHRPDLIRSIAGCSSNKSFLLSDRNSTLKHGKISTSVMRKGIISTDGVESMHLIPNVPSARTA